MSPEPAHAAPPAPRGSAERFIDGTLVLSCVAAGYVFVKALVRARAGYDFSDEGMYLNAVAYAGNYSTQVSFFGEIYHPLFRLVGEDVVAFRRAGLLLTGLLTFGVALLLLQRIEMSWRAVAGAGAASVAGLLVNYYWLVTPNYNTLTLQGALIVAAGVLVIERWRDSTLGTLGCVAVGVGGWLSAMAKPPAGVTIGVVALLLLGGFGIATVRRVVVIGVSAVLTFLLFAVAVYGSPVALIAQMVSGGEAWAVLGYPPSALLRWDPFMLTTAEKWVLLANFLLTLAVTLMVMSRKAPLVVVGSVVAAVFLVYVTVAGMPGLPWVLSEVFALQLVAPALGTMAAIALRSGASWRSRQSLVAISFLLMPLAVAFGTDVSLWRNAGHAAFFWVVGAAVLAAPAGRFTDLVPVLAISVALTSTVIAHEQHIGYRQTTPTAQQRDPTRIGTMGNVQMSSDFADYLDALRESARKAGFRPGTPMIDLTGHYPGAVFALGAIQPGAPWLIGGYPGSAGFAKAALAKVPCEQLQAAWLLSEPTGPRAVPMSVLPDGQPRYEAAARVKSPTGAYPISYEQILYRPLPVGRSADACAGNAK